MSASSDFTIRVCAGSIRGDQVVAEAVGQSALQLRRAKN